MQEVPSEKFLSDVKLLLFGVDSDSFRYNAVVRGFNGIALAQTCTLYVCTS